MNEVDYLKILKWVLIVLLAGFIGQFGKSLAKHLMEKARLKKEKLAFREAEIQEPEVKASPEESIKEDLSTKMDEDPDLEQVKEDAKMGKKALKTLVKQKKKEAKLPKKEEG